MDGDPIKVVENIENLGQVVSGVHQIVKNVDLRIKKGRGSLYGLLGPAFAFECLLSPVLKLHFCRTYIYHILKYGISSFPIRKADIEPLAIYQRKILRSQGHIFLILQYTVVGRLMSR